MTATKTKATLLAETVDYFTKELKLTLQLLENNSVPTALKVTAFDYIAAIAGHCQQEAENLATQAA